MRPLKANWQAPSNVFALSTTTEDGYSTPPYDSLNLAEHVGDNLNNVYRNRQHLKDSLHLPAEPEWLLQTHSNLCVVTEDSKNRNVDAAVTRQPNTVLAILTADCLPIILTNQSGTEIAAIHAGWRGLAQGIIESTLAQMHASPSDLCAWIGPSICVNCYQTGEEVRDTFMKNYPFGADGFHQAGHDIFANLPHLAECILKHLGITAVSQSNQCTAETSLEDSYKKKYYSYRRQPQTGRIATLIWFN
jgi:YfiH family protein